MTTRRAFPCTASLGATLAPPAARGSLTASRSRVAAGRPRGHSLRHAFASLNCGYAALRSQAAIRAP
jgi:hypothetical protein